MLTLLDADIMLQAVETPLPPNWGETRKDDGKTVYTNDESGESSDLHPSDAYFVKLINRERAKGTVSSAGGAWMEFHEDSGEVYYFDFCEEARSCVKPASLCIPPFEDDRRVTAQANGTTISSV
jgi:hypothetical protein